MKRNHLLLYLVACVILFSSTACSNDDLIEGTELVSETQIKHPHRIMSNLNPKDYNVNIDMVKGYLRLTKRIDDMRSITPLTIDQDTLAWAVQYQKGWQVLSGDSRLAPVMISSEESELDLKEQSPNTNAVNGLLYYIKDIHYGADTLKNRVWKFLETSDLKPRILRSPRRAGGEIATRGMWIAVDSSYEYSNEVTVPHIIQTKWGQGVINTTWNEYSSPNPQHKCPWNGYTETINGKHCVVGCAPVAVGQIIYKYRKNNNRGIAIPMNGNITNDIPQFSGFSSNAWSLFANDSSETNLQYTAIFLSYIGSQMGIVYGLTGSSLPENNIDNAISEFLDFELVCSSGNSYNYNIICGSLANSSPVCVFASEARLPGQPQFLVNSHTFILDSKRERNDYIKVTYLWDNDYEVSWEEYNRLDPWRFEMPDDYDPIENNEVFHEHNISISTSIDFAMNWGFDGNSDNVYYIASYRSYPNSDEYGSYPGTYTEYQPYWTYSSFAFTVIDRLIYNFHEL